MSENVLHEGPPEICMVEVADHSIFGGVLQQESSHPYKNYCSSCVLHFDNVREFNHHIAEVHKSEQTPKQQMDKSYPCSLCNLTFKRHDHLKRHIRSLHTEQKYSKCPVCSKEYSEKGVLSQHIKKVHAGRNETYKCRECDYQCDSLRVLLIHELDHMARHSCPHCTMSYKRRDHMTRHVKSEHMKLVVACPMCDQIYKRKDHLVRHLREKHKNNPSAFTNHVVFPEKKQHEQTTDPPQ